MGRGRGSRTSTSLLCAILWLLACRKATEERVLTQPAFAASSKELWRLVSSEGLPVKVAAKALGIPANTTSKAGFDDMYIHKKDQTS